MQDFYKIRTPSARYVGVGSDGVIRPAETPACAAVLFRPPNYPTLGFMFAEAGVGASCLTISGAACKTAIQPWRIRQTDKGVILHDPSCETVLVERHNELALEPLHQDAAEAVVQLEPMALSERIENFAKLNDLLSSVLPKNLNGPDMLDVIGNTLTQETGEPVQAVLRLLPRDQMEWIAGTLLGLPSHLARFSAAYPDDIWASTALPNLREWLQTRRGATHLQIGPELDFLAEAGLNGRPTTAAHMLNAAARAGVPPRRKVCVVATARNEGLYLLEWIAYHRLVGADAVFVYSNDNSDGSNELLHALAMAGAITWIDSEIEVGKSAQPKAYGHAFGILPDVLDYRWSLVIDLDEFFSFNTTRFQSLPDYIDWQETQQVDAVALNWLVYGSGGVSVWDERPLLERFTKRLPWIDPHIKSMSRTNICIQSHPHHAQFDSARIGITRDCDGARFQSKDGASFAATPRAENAWISHYFLKSTEEFIWKFSRNRGDHALVREADPALIDKGFAGMFVRQHQSPTMVDDQRALACAPDLRAHVNRLRLLPGVATAETNIRSNYKAGVIALIDRIRNDKQFNGEDLPYEALLKC